MSVGPERVGIASYNGRIRLAMKQIVTKHASEERDQHAQDLFHGSDIVGGFHVRCRTGALPLLAGSVLRVSKNPRTASAAAAGARESEGVVKGSVSRARETQPGE